MPIDKNKTAFVFIEFQKEWIGKDGRLGRLLVKDTDNFHSAIKNAEGILSALRISPCHIAHAGLDLRHDPDYLVFGKGIGKAGLAGAIPKANTWKGDGAEFEAPFVPQNGEFVVKGRSGASVLKNSTLDPYLRNNGLDTIVLMGFATHVCVESTLREGHDAGLNVYVVTDACAAFEREQDVYFQNHILHHFGKGITTEELLRALDEG